MNLKKSVLLIGIVSVMMLSSFASGKAVPTQGTIDFASVKSAKLAGWSASTNAKLSITSDSELRKYALQAKVIKPKKYSGIHLNKLLDLSGADAKDTISFYVKENYGNYLRINIHSAQGSIWRGVRIKPGKWQKITLSLDLSKWHHKEGAKWGETSRISFYEKSFSKPGQQLYLNGLNIVVSGKHLLKQSATKTTLNKWTFPYKTDKAWVIGNKDAAWKISRKNGQVIGGWNVKTKQLYLKWDKGKYYLQTKENEQNALENNDQVTKVNFDKGKQQLQIICTNPDAENLKIKKDYSIIDGRLIKQTVFTSSQAGMRFITFNSEVSLDSGYRNGGYYMGAGFIGPLVPAPQLTHRKKITSYRSTSKSMVLSQPHTGYSFAQYRYKSNGYFVWPWFSMYGEMHNHLYYTPTGWEISLGTHKLIQNKPTSYEEQFNIFKGNWYDYLDKIYPSLPLVKKEFSKIPAVPKWLSDVKVGYSISTAHSGMQQVKRLPEVFGSGKIMVTFEPSYDWASYFVSSKQKGPNGGYITNNEIKSLYKRIKKVSPRITSGIYNWMISTFSSTPIYKKHPSWFKKNDKDGNAVNLFPGFHANYASMIDNPKVFKALQDQFKYELRYLDEDFMYLDGSKTSNIIDWQTGNLNTDYQWQKFWLDMNLQAKKYNPNTLIFFNGRGNPYAGLNYIEARSQLRAGYWRQFAGTALGIQTFIQSRPGVRIMPLYWTSKYAQQYVNYCLALGWIPRIQGRDVLSGRPFIEAMYEVGNVKPIDAHYSPDWKRNQDTQLESYFVKRYIGGERQLSVTSHAKKTKQWNIKIDTDSLDLPHDKNLYIWRYPIANASKFNGRTSEDFVKNAYKKTSWMLDKITTPKLLYHGPYKKTIELSLKLKPLDMQMISISSTPGAVVAQNNLPRNFRYAATRHVNVLGQVNTSKHTVSLTVNSKADTAQVMAILPKGATFVKAAVDGLPVQVQLRQVGKQILPVITVKKGKHNIVVKYTLHQNSSVKVSNITAKVVDNHILLALPTQISDAKAVLATVSRSGRVVFNKMIKINNNQLNIPLTAHRKGIYQIVLSAAKKDNGKLIRIIPVSTNITLKNHKPVLNLTSNRDPRIAATKQIKKVDKIIKGVHILRQAAQTSSTPNRGWLPKLKGLTASADNNKLTLEAGTLRKTVGYAGTAFAGFEFNGVKKVKLRLDNTYFTAFHDRGPGHNTPFYRHFNNNFAGIILNYHTSDGYTKKVALSVGVLSSDSTRIQYPTYGNQPSKNPDQYIKLGNFVNESSSKTFSLNLEHYAPKNWDGRVWFNVGSSWVAPNRRLKATILAVNKKITGAVVKGINSAEIFKLYHQKRTLVVPQINFKTPMIDGVTDEELWHGAADIPTEQFFILGGKGRPKMNTSAKVFYYGDKYLYIAVRCQETKRKTPMTGHGSIWRQDEIEIWIDDDNNPKTFYQIIVNADGNNLVLDQNGPAKLPGLKAATNIEPDKRWTVEVKIPFKGLGIKSPKSGQKWRFNIARHRPGGGKIQEGLITWSPLEHGFKDIKNFNTIKFGK